MRRVLLILAPLAVLGWAGILLALAMGASGRTARGMLALAAATTAAAHLAAVLGSGLGRRPVAGPGWVAVQGEKHRRKGACFAAWGVAAAVLAWALARPTGTDAGWPAWFAAAANLGFQPGLLVAGGLGAAARARLARSAAGPGLSAPEEGPDL